MCGRYTLTIEAFQLKVFLDEAFSFFERRDFSALRFLEKSRVETIGASVPNVVNVPHFNISPGHLLPIIRLDEETGALVLDVARWGLVPSWVKKPKEDAIKDSFKMINARIETLAEKPSFRSAFARNRILVPMTGYYEWKPSSFGVTGNSKQPYYIHSGKLMFALGLREVWQSKIMGTSDENIETFCLLTKNASPKVSSIHHRSPLFLDYSPNRFQTSSMKWLSKSMMSIDELIGMSSRLLLKDEEIEMDPVSMHVNSSNHNSIECVLPIQDNGPSSDLPSRSRAELNDSQLTFSI